MQHHLFNYNKHPGYSGASRDAEKKDAEGKSLSEISQWMWVGDGPLLVLPCLYQNWRENVVFSSRHWKEMVLCKWLHPIAAAITAGSTSPQLSQWPLVGWEREKRKEIMPALILHVSERREHLVSAIYFWWKCPFKIRDNYRAVPCVFVFMAPPLHFL